MLIPFFLSLIIFVSMNLIYMLIILFDKKEILITITVISYQRQLNKFRLQVCNTKINLNFVFVIR